MIRDVDILEISDGHFYRGNDLVKANTGGCTGCSRCCCGMGDSILLDPLDVYRLEKHTGMGFGQLLEEHTALGMADGLILPHLVMGGEEERCTFLGDGGRCRVHAARPGFCRLFPLGRYYQGDDFVYFLQADACPQARSKIRVKKWMDTPDFSRYEEFIRQWHAFLETARKIAGDAGTASGETVPARETGGDGGSASQDAVDPLRRQICLTILRIFYEAPWEDGDFYPQFEERLRQAGRMIGIA